MNECNKAFYSKSLDTELKILLLRMNIINAEILMEAALRNPH